MKKKLDIIDINDLIGCIVDENENDIRDFDDILNLDAGINDRNIMLGDIEVGVGTSVDGVIRFWNRYDDRHNIPVENRKPIKIYIDSNGGSLTDAFTAINAINMSKTPVYTIVTGTAYSAGFFISIAGHKRYAYPLASFLYHEGSASNGGTAGQFRNFADFYDKQLEQLKKHTLKCTNITEEKYKEIKKDDIWMTTDDALEIGAIDEICEELI